jgi:hypothetical protein
MDSLDESLFYTFSILTLCTIFSVAKVFRDELYLIGDLNNKVDASTQTEETQVEEPEEDDSEELLNISNSIIEHVAVQHNPARRFSIW